MGNELFVALALIMHLHVVNGFSSDRSQRVKYPSAFRASPALEILAFGPYQFATHRGHRTLLHDLWLCLFEKRPSTFFNDTATAKADSA